MKNTKKYIINTIIIAVIFIALILYIIIEDGIDNIIQVLNNINYTWALAGLGCMILYWLLEAMALNALTKKFYPKEKLSSSFRNNMIGQLFNNLTPFASGGQPIQVWVMGREGKSMVNAAAIFIVKTIVYQIVYVLFALGVLIFRYGYFVSMINNFVIVALVGFSVNVIFITALIVAGVSKKAALSIMKPIYKFLGIIRIMKNVDERLSKLENTISSFHEQFKTMGTQVGAIIRAALYTLLQLIVYCIVTYTIYRAFGFSESVFVNILCAQAFLTMMLSFIPTPGSGGAAEGGFYVIFSNFFTGATIKMSILFWRMYTFYLPIIVGAIFMLAVKNVNKGKNELNNSHEKAKQIEEDKVHV